MTSYRIKKEELMRFCQDACLTAGYTQEVARAIAEVLVETDMLRSSSHGTRNLVYYIRKTRAGGIRPDAAFTCSTEGPAYALYDAGADIGMMTGIRAMRVAMEKARRCGIAIVNVRNSTHFGAAGYYAQMAAKEGMLGIAMGNTEPNMSIPGGKGKGIGNSPLAIAFPQKGGRPVFLDIALSAVASLKIVKAAETGTPIPDTWAVDSEGYPTTNPQDYLDGGAAQPMASYKGYGLAMMIELLTGLVSGGKLRFEMTSWLFDLAAPNEVSHSFIAVDIGKMIDMQTYYKRLDQYIREIRESPKRSDTLRIYVPGEIENDRYTKAEAEGIPLPEDVAKSLNELSEETGTPLKLEVREA